LICAAAGKVVDLFSQKWRWMMNCKHSTAEPYKEMQCQSIQNRRNHFLNWAYKNSSFQF